MNKLALTLTLIAVWTINGVHAAEIFCSSGDVSCLIASINDSNQNGEENTINLAAGTYILTSIDNGSSFNANGLPVITGAVIINGESAETTIIERDPNAPAFRIFNAAATGRLTLNAVTVRGGAANSGNGMFNAGTLTVNYSIIEGNRGTGFGGGIQNTGILLLSRSVVTDNAGGLGGGGIFNSAQTRIMESSITQNFSMSGGGVSNGEFGVPQSVTASMTIQNSTISDNIGDAAGGLANGGSGSMTIVNSTIANNVARFFSAGGISNGGMLTITNSTIARNAASTLLGSGTGGGIAAGQTVKVQNTIVALNSAFGGGLDCSGSITSLGNNIIGDPSNCDINLLPSDSTGNPGLGDFVDDGTPGNGHFPLVSGSQAVDKANSQACPETDQLGNPRISPCDIGSVEFRDGRLLVSIDVRPRSDANKVNPNSSKSINVAIFSTNGFDASAVDVNTVRFGATGTEAAPIHIARRDVEKDGDRDIVFRFQIQESGIQCGDTSATLTAQTSAGQPIIGSSPITTTGCRPEK